MDTTCCWDANPASVTLFGTPVCAVHAVCAWCGTPLLPDRPPFGCRCDKYGNGAHEDKLYCSEAHMLADHPDGRENDE